METFLPSLLIVFFFLLAVLIVIGATSNLFEIEDLTVPPEKRVVVYRRGRVHRIAGPGPLTLYHKMLRPLPLQLVEWDRVGREIDVRSTERTFIVDGFVMHKEVPFGYTLKIWCQTDLQRAADDPKTLEKLALIDDAERLNQARSMVGEALQRSIARLEQERPLPEGAELIQKLIPALRGSPDNQRLLEILRQELERLLPLVGMFLVLGHPIHIASVHLPPTLIQVFSVARTSALLRKSLPDSSLDLLVQMLSSIEGLEPPTVQKLLLEDGGRHNLRTDVSVDEESLRTRVRIYPQSQAEPAERIERIQSEQPLPAGAAEVLTDEDLSVLRSVPRGKSRARASA